MHWVQLSSVLLQTIHKIYDHILAINTRRPRTHTRTLLRTHARKHTTRHQCYTRYLTINTLFLQLTFLYNNIIVQYTSNYDIYTPKGTKQQQKNEKKKLQKRRPINNV